MNRHTIANDLIADNETAWVGVHVMTEFMFCPRAGLVAWEQGHDDRGEELDYIPPLTYLPDFSIELIERVLEQTWNGIWRTLTWTPPVLLVVFVCGLRWDFRLMWGLVPLGLGLAAWLFQRFRIIAELARRLEVARAALPQEPDPNSQEMQPVNWWRLLKAGFTPVEYEEPHADEDWKLVGHPWRVLVKGSLRIPVFRKRRGSPQVFPQHKARLAAYCHLVERSEGGHSPYGVILFGEGHDGITLPNTSGHRQLFHNAIRELRNLIHGVRKNGLMPDIPQNLNTCQNCPIGRPRVHRRGITETKLPTGTLPVYQTLGEDHRLYHSPCGDRFQWVPPHERAEEKGLH